MGQSASKATARAAATRRSTKGAAAVAAAANAPTSNVSSTAAAAEASARVRPPTFDTPPSAQDLAQRQVLQGQRGGDGGGILDNAMKQEDIELPPDLVDFLKDAGPLQAPSVATKASISSSSKPNLTADRRQKESMPLAQQIAGYETVKSTSFSRTEPPPLPAHIYQHATTLDLYRLVAQKPQQQATQDSENTLQSIVERTYAAYGRQYTLPSQEHQAQHQNLLRQSLKYLDVPVVMQDTTAPSTDASYDGIHPSQIDSYQTIKFAVVPPTRARLVLTDLDDLEQTQLETAPASAMDVSRKATEGSVEESSSTKENS